MAVKRYDGSAWQTVAGLGAQGAAATSSSIATWVKTASGGETSVSGNDDNSQPLSYTVGQELVFINGVLQKRDADYTATTGNSITGLTALTSGDIVSVWTVNAFSVTNAISNTIMDAKGDLLTASGADVPARLAVGSNNTVLTADSSTATGLKWATPASGVVSTWTLLNAGGTALTGSGSITITGISNQKEILVLVDGASSTTTNVIFGLRPNSDSGINYSDFGWSFFADSAYAASNAAGYTDGGYSGSTEIRLAQGSSNAASIVRAACHITSADQTGWKKFSTDGGATASGGSGARAYSTQGLWEASAAITSINIFCNAGNFDAGTVYVFGGA
jgi:hypothetical protein